MERSQGFNFKLLVPTKVNSGQINAVRPQEKVDNSGNFLNALQQGYNRCIEKENNMPGLNTSVVAPSKATRPDFDFHKMKVVPLMEKDENCCSSGELYSKLFDEVEKIKCWKVKVDSDTVQKERKLQDNKRTIETQRKAIQELQFANESLSIKVEDQISENEDLRSKNFSTRNLCNILKETFQWSAEKMHLFESERQETHQLFMENDGSIKKLIAAFEDLRVQVEADQQEMRRVKEDLLQYERQKEKYHQENVMKNEEIVMLQTKLTDKEDELQQVQCDLDKSQKYYEQLQESTTAALKQSKAEYEQIIRSKDTSMQELNRFQNQQTEKLEKIETAMEELKNSLNLEMQSVKDLEEKLMANNKELEQKNALLEKTMKQAKKRDDQIKILENELDTKSKSIENLKSKTDVFEARVQELVEESSRKTEEIQMFQSEAQVASAEKKKLKQTCEDAEKAKEELKEKLMLTENKVLELKGQLSVEMKKNEDYTFQLEYLKSDITQHEVKYEELLSNFNKLQSEQMAQVEEHASIQSEAECECLLAEITAKEKHIKAVEEKLCNLRKKIEIKFKIKEQYKSKNKQLRKEIEMETAKSRELEMMVDNLQEESQNLKMKEMDYQKMLQDFESKSMFAAELENEVQKLRLTAAEAIKNKEETELKCQHKIADMVALMEKHKSQYDRMVEEKDAELEENKKREEEAAANAKSLELEVLKQKTENDLLKTQAKAEAAEKEKLQKKVTNLTKELSTVKSTQLSQGRSEQSPAPNSQQGRVHQSPEENSLKSSVFDFSKSRKTPSSRSAAVLKKTDSAIKITTTPHGTSQYMKHILNEDMRTPGKNSRGLSVASKIKSYRIRTPPTDEKAAKHTLDLDPKSDSSDHFDLLTLANVPAPSVPAPQSKLNILRKLQSPVTLRSPGNSLKLAAIKRMRDAGWTAVTGCDKKKKKTNEKIFA